MGAAKSKIVPDTPQEFKVVVPVAPIIGTTIVAVLPTIYEYDNETKIDIT
jgi:hypothetical protein